jgi:hypothetical protein
MQLAELKQDAIRLLPCLDAHVVNHALDQPFLLLLQLTDQHVDVHLE